MPLLAGRMPADDVINVTVALSSRREDEIEVIDDITVPSSTPS
jgi:hypothetical protein